MTNLKALLWGNDGLGLMEAGGLATLPCAFQLPATVPVACMQQVPGLLQCIVGGQLLARLLNVLCVPFHLRRHCLTPRQFCAPSIACLPICSPPLHLHSTCCCPTLHSLTLLTISSHVSIVHRSLAVPAGQEWQVIECLPEPHGGEGPQATAASPQAGGRCHGAGSAPDQGQVHLGHRGWPAGALDCGQLWQLHCTVEFQVSAFGREGGRGGGGPLLVRVLVECTRTSRDSRGLCTSVSAGLRGTCACPVAVALAGQCTT